MANNFLTTQQASDLEIRHARERDGKARDRIKAILLAHEGWTHEAIACVLRIHEDTVSRHVQDYIKQNKLENTSGGSVSFLSAEKSLLLKAHLNQNMYAFASQICDYVKHTFSVQYSVAGMTAWLHQNGFSHRMPNGVPAKSNLQAQEEFVKQYNIEKAEKQEQSDHITLFFDAVHPTINTKICKAWLPEGKQVSIPTTGAKTRVNIAGSLNLASMDLVTTIHETISSVSMQSHLCVLRNLYPNQKITLILDQGSYNRCKATKDCAARLGITLLYLPPYSPNLNPIERVWKILNEYVRNNKTFENGRDFEEKIKTFLRQTWFGMKDTFRSRVNDNFQIVQPCTSS